MLGILDEFQRDYYCNVRKFSDGSVEMCTRVVKPMQLEQAKIRYASWGGAPVHRSDDSDSEQQSLYEKQANWARGVRRARQTIRWLCKEMGADRLFTLTYRANVEDRDIVKADFKEFLRLVRKGGFQYRTKAGEIRRAPPQKDWKYVAVLERQDRGALHIHVAVKGWQRVDVLRAAWYRAASNKAGERLCGGLEQGTETPGAVNVTSPRDLGKNRREWKTSRLAGYITKYLHKTFDECQAEKKRYWSAKDLRVPVKERIWLTATNMHTAILQTWNHAVGVYGLIGGDSFHWLSDDKCNYWLSGGCDDLIATGCPF
jgi:hypothetical protein